MQNGKTNVLADIIKQWGKDVETNLVYIYIYMDKEKPQFLLRA